jgi:hypothetical protein
MILKIREKKITGGKRKVDKKKAQMMGQTHSTRGRLDISTTIKV